jgi:Caspase domain/Domain of unknown function (DUF4384)
MKRRHFLQSAAATLTTLGMSQLQFTTQADRTAQVLAQFTPRKLALLVGINGYQHGILPLQGCVNDVMMQYFLLVHRFGFRPEDILILADEPLMFMNQKPLLPTRSNILQAFETHLIQQAKPGDVVLFHFSGHGSQVPTQYGFDPKYINSAGQQIAGTIVPIDRMTPEGKARDIMGRSLFLLTKAIKTDNVTMILDSCHSGGTTRLEGYQVRAVENRPQSQLINIDSIELEYQEQWIRKLKLNQATIEAERKENIAKGIAIGSAQYNQYAMDQSFDNGKFHAGTFSYLLTRYLWQATGNLSTEKAQSHLIQGTKAVALNARSYQLPLFNANPESNRNQPIYFVPMARTWSDAVVQRVKTNGEIEYWLGGMSALGFVGSRNQSSWTAIDSAGREIGEIRQRDRKGLVGWGKLTQGTLSDIQPGTLLRERIRNIPANLRLKLGLHESLDQTLEAIREGLTGHPYVELVSIADADYFLGGYGAVMGDSPEARLHQQVSSQSITAKSLGLFKAGGSPIENSFASGEESGRTTVTRLQGTLKFLLAGLLLKLMTGVDTLRSPTSLPFQIKAAVMPMAVPGVVTPAEIPINQPLQIRIQNDDSRDLYVAALAINGNGEIVPMYPYWDSTDREMLVKSGKTLSTPPPVTPTAQKSSYVFKGVETGDLEVLVLASEKPIANVLQALRSIAVARGGVGSRSAFGITGDESIKVMESLLGNLNQSARETQRLPIGVMGIDTRQIAAISIPVSIR